MYVVVIRNDWAWEDLNSGAELICKTVDEVRLLLDIALNSHTVISIRKIKEQMDDTPIQAEEGGR